MVKTEIHGKTKVIIKLFDNTVLMVTKDVLTAGDAARTAEIKNVGKLKTQQAANVFKVLTNAGVPNAFIKKSNDKTLICWHCDMIPLECVVRRYAWGSYLKRNPDIKPGTQFKQPIVEFHHKHTLITPPAVKTYKQIPEDEARELYLKDGKWAEGVYTDPYIDENWGLHPAKEPIKVPIGFISPLIADVQAVKHTLLIPAFHALEEAWGKIDTKHGPVALVDCKFELGTTTENGEIVVADVVDNDSWRIWPGGDPKQQLDKQSFRDNESLQKVENNYQLVATLTEQMV